VKKESVFLILFLCHTATAQDTLRSFFRIYTDNDALNFPGTATDWGYTSGIGSDFFYLPAKKKAGLSKGLPRLSGATTIVTRGWRLMQIIIAPKKTNLFVPDKNDYPYSGALFAVHNTHSSNTIKKINLQSEWVAGVMGSPSLAKETHSFFHCLIKDPPPNGWRYQLPVDLLLNYNMKIEKQLAAYKNISLIGGGEIFFGSMVDGFSLLMQWQFGRNPSYFSGMINQCCSGNKKPKLIISLRSTVNVVAYNALLEGGLFNRKSPKVNKYSDYGTHLQRQKTGGSIEIFSLLSFRKASVSFTQKTSSPEFKGYVSHTTGNISIYKAF
jgi:hypothetical protein